MEIKITSQQFTPYVCKCGKKGAIDSSNKYRNQIKCYSCETIWCSWACAAKDNFEIACSTWHNDYCKNCNTEHLINVINGKDKLINKIKRRKIKMNNLEEVAEIRRVTEEGVDYIYITNNKNKIRKINATTLEVVPVIEFKEEDNQQC